MRSRWLCVVAIGLAPLLGGCGGVGSSSASESSLGERLTIYSSLPLRGATANVARQVLAGERMALLDAHGRVGRLRIRLVSLDDSNPQTGTWDPGATTANAKLAAQDTTAIAYIGDYDSPATAVSLPITNGAGILQVSPASPYAGLTSSQDAGQDEPERFYPSARRTFGRLAPGDPVQALAQTRLMRTLGVHSVYVLCDQDPFDVPLAQLLAADARDAGVGVRGLDVLDVPPTQASFAGEVAKLREAHPAAVFLSAAPTLGAAGLFRELHAALPGTRLLASSSLSDPSFYAHLGSAAGVTLIGTPLLPVPAYGDRAERLLRRLSQPHQLAGASVLYGYEAMSVVLAAIHAAGSRGDDRRAVIESFFATRRRRSPLGAYSMHPDGESTLSSYGIERVRSGGVAFWRVFDVAR
ncbi:MAG: branched-chain amino acid ABC transporter substrate-binding protein [Solirubrobacteraceae bacterium]